MPYIHTVATQFPRHLTSQEEVLSVVTQLWPDKRIELEQFFNSSGVRQRSFVKPLGEYKDLGDFGKRNVEWKKNAVELQKNNIEKILTANKIRSEDLGLIASVNTTGLCVPSLEALLLNKCSLSSHIKRLPIFGLGCLGGVAGINRVNDYLLGHPNECALVLVTELCSLTFQFTDHSIANAVGTALFGDGTGAVLLLGDNHRLANHSPLEVLATKSHFYHDTENLMGWSMVENGFQIMLSPDIPKLVKENLGKNLQSFVHECGYELNDIDFFVAHPGGPKVLEAMMESLKIKKETIALSWDSLAEHGNVSAVSVIDVLKRTLEKNNIRKGCVGIMLAMGPAFALEMTMVKKC